MAKRIVPATAELLPVFNELDAFVRHLSQEIVVQLQNLPERDSESRSSRTNRQIAAEAVNVLTGARNGLGHPPTEVNHFSNAQQY